MKKSILVMAMAMMAVVMIVTPVFAKASPQIVPAVFTPTNVVTTGGTKNTTPSGIIHVNNAVRTATANLKIGNVMYVGSINVDLDYIVNPIKGTTTQHYHKMTMTFQPQNGISEEGVFTGVITWTAELGTAPGSVIPTTLAMHAVLQGSGGFEGYMLHLITEPPLVSNSWVLIR